MRNHIATLQDAQGIEHKEQRTKATILYKAFKQRLGTSVPTYNLLSLDLLITRHNDLEEHFSKEEIDTGTPR